MRRTFILHANGSKLPSDLLGLTCVRYEATTPTAVKVINQKLRKAIENEGRVARIEGQWWQFSLTERTAREPSAVSLLSISRNRDGTLELMGRSWQEDGTLSARYWSEAVKEKKESGASSTIGRRTAVAAGRATVGRDGGNPNGVGRARVRVLHDSFGHGSESDTRTAGVYLVLIPRT